MRITHLLHTCILATLVIALFHGCATPDPRYRTYEGAAAAYHADFREEEGWRTRIYRNPAVLDFATSDNVSVVISIADQRGLLLANGVVAMDFPVATGKRSHPTPPGNFTILEKERDYASNLYGTIYDAGGNAVTRDADIRKDPVPEGGYFKGADMPNWMRLTWSGVGMHIGYVPGRPASHGCIRLQREPADVVYNLVKKGTPVRIISKPFDPASARGAGA